MVAVCVRHVTDGRVAQWMPGIGKVRMGEHAAWQRCVTI